jgi:hypothetical protein
VCASPTQGALLVTALMALFVDELRQLAELTPLAHWLPANVALGAQAPVRLLPPAPPPPALELAAGDADDDALVDDAWAAGVWGARLRDRVKGRMAGILAASLPPPLLAPDWPADADAAVAEELERNSAAAALRERARDPPRRALHAQRPP